MRVLFVGHCKDLYIGYLNDLIKEFNPRAISGVVNLFSPGGLDNKVEKYDYLYDTKAMEPCFPKNWFKRFGQYGWKKVIKHTLLLEFPRLKREIINLDFRLREDAQLSNIIEAFTPTHIHVHYLNKKILRWVDVVPDSCKIILSFWGSDLMNTDGGLEAYEVQYRALRKADVITAQTIDLRTILLCKFGQELLPKIQYQTFNPLINKAELIERLSLPESRKKLKRKYKIDESKHCIQVGYSAAPGQNHLRIIKQINLLPDKLKEKITVFLPLSYNASSNYVPDLLEKVKIFDFEIIPIIEFLSDEDILAITAGCETFIALRDHDALNASMVESLYAGNSVITGSWLPYHVYTRNQINFESIDKIETLKESLEFHLMQPWIQNMANRDKLRELYNSNLIKENWKKVYL